MMHGQKNIKLFVTYVYSGGNNETNCGLCERVCQRLQSSNIHTPFLFHWPLLGGPQINF